MGERAILVSWPQEIEENLLYFILEVKKSIQKNTPKPILEINNTYSSLIIKYTYTINNFYDQKKRIIDLISTVEVPPKLGVNLYTLPVCYADELGVDLEAVARQKNLSKEAIIDLHTAPVYTIYFIGFLPGFLYLGGLDNRLKISRKKEPRLRVEKGAVGLAENQTGIYPKTSPGGWQIIGNCPVSFFDPFKNPPSVFRPGDKLQFKAVSLEAYKQIQQQVDAGEFHLTLKKISHER